jgi:hypothetical protein
MSAVTDESRIVTHENPGSQETGKRIHRKNPVDLKCIFHSHRSRRSHRSCRSCRSRCSVRIVQLFEIVRFCFGCATQWLSPSHVLCSQSCERLAKIICAHGTNTGRVCATNMERICCCVRMSPKS